MDNSNTARKAKGFLTMDGLIASIGARNTVLDPYSVLMSEGVSVGKGNVFYPNVIIECRGGGSVSVGDNNIFYPGTYILGSVGAIDIDNENEFGSGGCTIKANLSGAKITIGSNGRYSDGASIMGQTRLGDGSQILGNIIVQSCSLEAGGDHRVPDPDERAAVLKGFGLARNIMLTKGRVVNGAGNFADAPVEWQHDYHLKVGPGA